MKVETVVLIRRHRTFLYRRQRRPGAGAALSVLLALVGATAWAQNPPPAQPAPRRQADDGTPGVRFTPEMARGIARLYAKNVLTRRYELEEGKVDQATEAVARRFMAMAHQVDAQGAEFVEYVMSEAIKSEAEGRNQAGLSSEMGRGIAERVLPVMPQIRDLLRDVSGDIRPMLGFKQQLKLTADMALAGTALNAFEQNMQRWSKGEAKPFENPFESQNAPPNVQKEADGTSKQFKSAQKTAEASLKLTRSSDWKKYVEEATKLYGFDASQSATAQSLLREFTQRGESLMQDTTWRDGMYRNRMWFSMLRASGMGWGSLLWDRLEEQQRQMSDPIDQLELDFKTRVDQIPTAAQREAADRHIESLLAEKGLKLTEAKP